MPLFDEKYYNAVRPYMPQDAKKVLDEQIPGIKAKVAEDITEFGKSYALFVKEEIENLTASTTQELDDSTKMLSDQISQLAEATKDSHVTLSSQVKELVEAMKAHEKKVTGWGDALNKSIKTVANTATASFGIPINIFGDKE